MAVICHLHALPPQKRPLFPVDSAVGGMYKVGLNVMAKENSFPYLEWNPGRQPLDSHLSCFSIKLALRNITSRKIAGSSPDKVIGFFFSIDLILPAALWPWGRLSL
jgi:hypothetical protein